MPLFLTAAAREPQQEGPSDPPRQRYSTAPEGTAPRGQEELAVLKATVASLQGALAILEGSPPFPGVKAVKLQLQGQLTEAVAAVRSTQPVKQRIMGTKRLIA